MIWGLKAGLGDGRVVEGKELGSGFFLILPCVGGFEVSESRILTSLH